MFVRLPTPIALYIDAGNGTEIIPRPRSDLSQCRFGKTPDQRVRSWLIRLPKSMTMPLRTSRNPELAIRASEIAARP